MRRTLTLHPDVEELIRRRMRERRMTFEDVVNEGLRDALRAETETGAEATPSFDLCGPHVDLDRALARAGDLEDAERIARLHEGR